MKRLMRKLLVGIYVFLLCLNSSVINLSAIESEENTDFEVSLEIDNSFDELTGNFDEVYRFNHYGIAIIAKSVVENDSITGMAIEVMKYGLMNLNGEILLEPKYDWINEYNDELFSVGNYIRIGTEAYSSEGLVSKNTGEIILEPKYTWIPELIESKLYQLGFVTIESKEESEYFQWNYETLIYRNGKFEKLIAPNGFNIDDFDYITINNNDGFTTVSATISNCQNEICSYDSIMWLVDEYGTKLSDRTFDYINGVSRISENLHYLTYTVIVNQENYDTKSGLIKVAKIDGELSFEDIVSIEDGYNNIWVDIDDNQIRFYKIVNDRGTWGYYDTVSGKFVDESATNIQSRQEVDIPGFSDLTIYNDCGLNDSRFWTCSYDINRVDGSKIVSDVNYESFSVLSPNHVLLYDWTQSGTYTNILYRNSAGEVQLVYDKAIKGFLNYSNTGYVYFYGTLENQSTLLLTSLHKEQPVTLVDNKPNVNFSIFSKYSTVWKTITDGDNSYIQYDVLENSTGEYLIEDVYGLGINYDENGRFFKGVFASNFDEVILPFIIKDNLIIRGENEVSRFEEFNQYGYAKVVKDVGYNCNDLTCYQPVYSIVNKSLEYLYNNADDIQYIDNGNAAIISKFVRDSSGEITNTIFDYVYLSNYVNTVQTPIIISKVKRVQIDNVTGLVSIIDSDDDLQYYQNGNALSDLNLTLKSAVKAGELIDGSIIYQNKISDTMFETFVSNGQGFKVELNDVDSFEGQIVKQGSKFSFVSINSNSEVVLTEIDQAISNMFINLQYVGNKIYTVEHTDGGKSIFSVSSNLNSEVPYIGIDFLKNGDNLVRVCTISRSANIEGYFEIDTYNVDGCNENMLGIVDSAGHLVIEQGFRDFDMKYDFIVAKRSVESEIKYTIFNTLGRNVLNVTNVDDEYFDSVGFDRLPYITVTENNSLKLFFVDGLITKYMGEIAEINRIGKTDFMQYVGLRDSMIIGRGLLNSKGDIIIEPEKDYDVFRILLEEKLIAPGKNVGAEFKSLGLYDFSGNALVQDDYGAVIKNDEANGVQRLNYDELGYFELSYYNPDLYVSTYNSENNTWRDENASSRVLNKFDLDSSRVIYNNPTFYDKSFTSDGYTLIRQLIRTNGSIEDAIANKYSYYYEVENNIKHLVEESIVVLDKSGNIIVDAGNYTGLDWVGNRNLVITSKCETVRKSANSIQPKCTYGLINKIGEVIVEPTYDSIYFDEEKGLYSTYINGSTDFDGTDGFINDNGEIILSGQYIGQITYNKDFNWLILEGKQVLIKDINSEDSAYASLTDILDLSSKKLIFKDLYNFSQSKLKQLKEVGYLDVSIAQEIGYLGRYPNYDPNTQTTVFIKYAMPLTWSGVIDDSGKYLLDPIYDEFYPLYFERASNLDPYVKVDGYYVFGNKTEELKCIEAIQNWDTKDYFPSDFSCYKKNIGVFSAEKGIVIEPNYSEISDINAEGFALAYSNQKLQTFSQKFKQSNGEFVSIDLVQLTSDKGLIDIFKGKEVVAPVYDEISGAVGHRSLSFESVPDFDKNGLINLYYSDLNFTYQNIANRNGLVLNGDFIKVYYDDGYFYAQNLDRTWDIYSAQDKTIILSLDFDETFALITSIKLFDNGKILTESILSNGMERYSIFGVLNEDLSEFLEPEFNKIDFDGTYWYLEKYNPTLGTYPRAIMNDLGNYVVPFSDRYDSLSEFVGGFAIGQSGTKEVSNSTSYSLGDTLLSVFFEEVHAEGDDFVLEVLDEQGRVVGDLSSMYESVTLLGEVDGTVRAMVKKDGKYFFANLVKTPIEVIRITGVELSNSIISLKKDERFQLIGKILPENYSERKSVSWTTEDAAIAIIDQNGLVTAVGPGTTIIKFKVNNFEALATVHVQKPVVVTPPNQDVKDAVELFVETIKATIKPNVEEILSAKEAFIEQLKALKQRDASYIQYLSDDERIEYEAKLDQFFGDQINIEVEEGSLPVKIRGLLLNLDIDKLLNGETIDIMLRVVKKDSVEEFRSFIDNQRYDDSIYHSFDLSIFDGDGNELNEFSHPIEFTLPLPEELRGKGELVLLHKHKDEVDILPVTLNIDFTFSFKTDKLSEFALIQNTHRVVEEPDKQSGGGVSFTPFIFSGLGLILTTLFIWFIRRKRISTI